MITRNYILNMLKPQPQPQSETQNHGEEDNKPRFKGVRMRKWGRWVAEIRRPNSREKIWLGSHQTAEEAARAYDAAALCVRGPNTYFNFPNDLPGLQPSGDMATAQIQMEAAKHAGKKITCKTYL